MKPFKTYKQQLTILRNRELQIPNESRAIRKLETENYYCIINGYKDEFLRSTSPEKYMRYVTFDELICAVDMDRELRLVYLEYLIKIEKSIKTQIAYVFSRNHPNNTRAFLDFNNYDNSRRERGFSGCIHDMISLFLKKMGDNNESIRHYINNHQEVPFWIIINSLTMGEVAYVYFYLKSHQRNDIAAYYSHHRRTEYQNNTIRVNEDDIKKMLKQGNIFRNACAHDYRFYKKRSASFNIASLKSHMKYFLTKRSLIHLQKN